MLLPAALISAVGYYLYEALITGSFAASLAGIPGSLVQTVASSIVYVAIGLAMDKYDIKPEIIIGCAGGGSNLGGLIAPFMGEKLRGEADYQFIAVEPASCPTLTRGV